MIVVAECMSDCILSGRSERYFRGQTYQLDLADTEQRKLVWLKDRLGWMFKFDRANSSDTNISMFFCKECGEPFDKLNQLGTHSREFHNKTKAMAEQIKADEEAQAEAKALAEYKPEPKPTKDAPGLTLAERIVEHQKQHNQQQA